jgi:hypothetical protein
MSGIMSDNPEEKWIELYTTAMLELKHPLMARLRAGRKANSRLICTWSAPRRLYRKNQDQTQSTMGNRFVICYDNVAFDQGWRP